MKLLTGLIALVLSFASIASTGETKTFTYDGSQNSVELILRGEETHTEYRPELRWTTCYRTEVRNQRICTNPGPGSPGGPRPVPQCHYRQVWVEVPYSCQQVVQIPFEVKDFDVESRILIDVTKLPTAMTPGEKFVVTLNGDKVSFSTVGSKKFFLMLKKSDLRTRISGSFKFIDGLYAVEMIEAYPILKALKMTNISLKNSVLSFGMGPVADRAFIGFSLKVVHKKFGTDNTLFNRELDASEVILNATSEGSAADVNVEKLGVTINDGRYSLTAKAFFKFYGTFLNEAQFEDLTETSRTLNYKVN